MGPTCSLPSQCQLPSFTANSLPWNLSQFTVPGHQYAGAKPSSHLENHLPNTRLLFPAAPGPQPWRLLWRDFLQHPGLQLMARLTPPGWFFHQPQHQLPPASASPALPYDIPKRSETGLLTESNNNAQAHQSMLSTCISHRVKPRALQSKKLLWDRPREQWQLSTAGKLAFSSRQLLLPLGYLTPFTKLLMKVPPDGTFAVSPEQQMVFQELSACLVSQV